jgi:hypothetical protein
MRLGLGLRLRSVLKSVGGAAPSGIPVASTTYVSIAIPSYESNSGVFTKKIPQQELINYGGVSLYSNIAGTCYVLGGSYGGSILFSPNAEAWNDVNDGSAQLGTPFGAWKIGQIDYDYENDVWFFTERATNPSTNENYIPNAGWSPSGTSVSKFSYSYASRIIITGSSSPNFNGTYNASSVPGYGNEYENRVDTYGFNGPSGNSLNWNAGEPRFELFTNAGGNTGGFGSGDGINWWPIETYIYEIAVSGFTSPEEANGTYLLDGIGSGLWVNQNSFIIQSGELYSDAAELIATNDNNYDGSWTLVSGSGFPTSSAFYVPSGSISGSVTTTTI